MTTDRCHPLRMMHHGPAVFSTLLDKRHAYQTEENFTQHFKICKEVDGTWCLYLHVRVAAWRRIGGYPGYASQQAAIDAMDAEIKRIKKDVVSRALHGWVRDNERDVMGRTRSERGI